MSAPGGPIIGPVVGPANALLDPARGLAIIDVDEVIGLFIAGFGRFLKTQGYELRFADYGLFKSIFVVGSAEPVERDQGKTLLDAFFGRGCDDIEPAPGAVSGLADLAGLAEVVILTNTPACGRELRGAWLARHGMPYPMIINEGPKGPAVRILADRVKGPVMFVDDLLHHLDSVAEAAPAVTRVQMVADPSLRPLAPSSPSHYRIDDWGDLVRLARDEVFA